MNQQHFLTLDDLDKNTLLSIITRAIDLKAKTKIGEIYEPLKNKSLAMIFSKSSTRTRVSFEVGMRQLGGGHIKLKSQRYSNWPRGAFRGHGQSHLEHGRWNHDPN